MDPLSLDNDLFCNHSIKHELRPLLIVFCSSGSVSAVITLFVIAAMIFFQLYKLLTHRLIINMLVSIFLFCMVAAAQFVGLWHNYWKGEHYGECVAGGFFMEYIMWGMLLTTLMMTVHLTSMVMFPLYYEKVAKLQPFYLAFPWILPLLIVWIPFINNNYGISGPWCWIRLYNEDCSQNMKGVIEMYALWYGELVIGLILNNIGLLVIAITLCKRSCSTNEMTLDYRKALKQALPLVIYPITVQFLSAFVIANRLYQSIHTSFLKWLLIAHAATSSSWGIFGPILTLIYLVILRKGLTKNFKKLKKCCCCSKEKQQKESIANTGNLKTTSKLLDTKDHLTLYGTANSHMSYSIWIGKRK